MPPDTVAAKMLGKARDDAEVVDPTSRHSDWIVAFHAQQAVEKALKAVLLARGLEPPYIHDLRELSRQVAATGSRPPIDDDVLTALSPWAAAGRYAEVPDDDDVDREHLVDVVTAILAWATPLVDPKDA